MRRALALAAVATLVVLGCGLPVTAVGGDGRAEERHQPGFSVVVTDRFEVTVEVKDAALYMPGSGMFSSGKAKRLERLTMWVGAHELSAAVDEIATIEVHTDEVEDDYDLIWVTVTLRNGLSQRGKIKRNIELKGTIPFGEYRIPLERAQRLVFDEAGTR